MGAIIWLLLGSEINYFLVLGVLLVSSIAGVIIHIPAGIGVLEAVFIAMLSGEDISKGAIIAALLAPARALLFPAIAAGDGGLSAAGEPGEKAAAKEPAQAGPRMKRSGRAALARAYGV